MSLTLLSRPDRSLAENPSRVSRWQSARQPYIFQFRRRDGSVISWVNNSGKLRIVVDDTDAAAQAVVGSTIYIGSSNSEYNIAGTITAITGSYVFDTDIDYTAAGSGGWFNLLDWANYFVEVKITGTHNGTTGVWHTLRVSVPKAGDVIVDLAPYLTGYITKQQIETSDPSIPDPYVWGSFVISYRQGWAGNTALPFTNDVPRYYYVDGVKQLLSTYGQNFAGHLVFPFNNTEKARFLSDFSKPTFFPGYPFDLTALIGEEMANDSDVVFNGTLDGGGALDAPGWFSLDTVGGGHVWTTGAWTGQVLAGGSPRLRNTTPMSLSTGGSYRVRINVLSITGPVKVTASFDNGAYTSGDITTTGWFEFVISNYTSPVDGFIRVFVLDNGGTGEATIGDISITRIVPGVYSSEQRFDINGTALSTGNQAVNIYPGEGAYRVTPIGGYGATVDSFDFWLEVGDAQPVEYFEAELVDDGYIETIPGVDIAPFRVTEKIRIKVGEVCKNPIFVSWRNSLGGWSYWLFQKLQEYEYRSKIAGVFGTEPLDIETANSRSVITEASMSEVLKVGATVKNEDVTGFRFLESSPCVLVYQSPNKWLRVQVSPKGVKYRTDGFTTTVEFDLISPEFYTVPN